MKRRLTLVTGGARSGKSRFALESAMPRARKAFIATATPCDKEMAARIARHRSERGADFLTIEEPLDLAGALGALPRDMDVAVVDCLTLWLGNLMHKYGGIREDDCPEIEALVEALRSPPCDLLVVTNEVGMGIVPENEAARTFRDVAGRLNARVARMADNVVLLVSGIPVTIKGTEKHEAT